MRVRLKRDVCGRAARKLASLFESNCFGVLDLFVNVEAFADHLAAA
jgi:hypothetical protein